MSDLNAYAIQVEALARRQIERIEQLEAENAKLRRQVELAKNAEPVCTGWDQVCPMCKSRRHAESAHQERGRWMFTFKEKLVHHPDCPNAEAT